MSSNDFQSLLSTFKVATGTGGAAASSSRINSSSSARKENNADTSTNVNDRKAKTEASDTAAALRPAPSQKSLLSATTELWRIAEIRRSAGISENTSSQTPAAFHLAICACVVDSLPHEDVWRRFMRSNNNNDSHAGGGEQKHGTSAPSSIAAAPTPQKLQTSAEMYIHSKHPIRNSSWARSKTISKSYQPEWNDVRIVRAMLALMEEALKDGRTTHILFVTESCIPIATLAEVAARIVVVVEGDGEHNKQKEGHDSKAASASSTCKLNWDRSFVDAYGRDSPRCTRFDERNCWDVLTRSIPSDAIHKALPGWCLLSRIHAEGILDLPNQLGGGGGQDLWPAFDGVWAPEEVYFPTCLALLGFLSGNNVVKQSLTYAEWNEKAKDHRDRAHPLEFDGCFKNDDGLIRRLREKGCTFIRKVKRPITLQVWEDAISDTSPGERERRRRRGRGQERRGQNGGSNEYNRDRDVDYRYSSSSGHKRHRDDDEGLHYCGNDPRYDRRGR